MVVADVELVDRLRTHGPEGLRDVYDQYSSRLFGYAMSVTHDPAMAEDAVQDSLLIAMGAIDKLREPSRFRSWLFSITRNECLRQLRHRGRMAFSEQSERELEQLADEVDLDKNLDQEHAAQLVQAALAMLSPADRDTMSIAIQNDLDSAATAEALGMSANHVHARMSRARAAMADAVRVVMLLGTNGKYCPELRRTIERTHEPGPLTRKRVLRHRRQCDDCERRSNKAVLSLASALAVPIVAAAPSSLSDRLFSHPQETQAQAAALAAEREFRPSDGFPVPVSPPGAGLLATPTALIAAASVVGVIALGAVIAAFVLLGGDSQDDLAPPVSAGSASPAPTGSTSPSPAPSRSAGDRPREAVVAAARQESSNGGAGAGAGSDAVLSGLPAGAAPGSSTADSGSADGGSGGSGGAGGNSSGGSNGGGNDGGGRDRTVLEAAFTVAGSGMIVRVDASGTRATGTGVEYSWRFGDGGRGSGKRTRHTYRESGTHRITLTVTDAEGQRSRTRHRVTVNSPPVAVFTVATAGLRVTVDASDSIDPTGDALEYAWDFTGDGVTDARGVTATHGYGRPGSHTISLLVADVLGASDTSTQTVSLNSAVSASFTSSANGLSVSVDASASSSNDSGPLSYSWDFTGDGAGDATGVTATHTYQTQGTKTIALTVTDALGASATTSASVVVNDDPVASFTTSVAGPVVSVDASASSDSGVLTYAWDFTGDGVTDATGVTASHTYTSSGNKTIELTVTDALGRTDSTTRTVSISGTPTAAFTIFETGGVVDVDASSSTDPFGLALTYDWTFESGPTATGVTASHFYTLPGTYAITLVVTNTDGLTDTLTQSVTVP